MNELRLRSFLRKSRTGFLSLLLSAIASLSYGGVVFNGSPGTAAPPNTLGGLQVFPFPLDPRTLGVDETFVNPAFDCPSSLLFSGPLNHRRIGAGWATWSHGYNGDVYVSNGTTITLTLPANTRAFYLYVEGNNFAPANITATANDGSSSGPVPVVGNAGARYYGFTPTILLAY
ncbi:MAG: hypothetical protein IPL25_18940 [Saprospiraceae bacterium]|nr:hypothetical protein [Candidatus Vicinibacter affinis]